jgi:hypothetical protein
MSGALGGMTGRGNGGIGGAIVRVAQARSRDVAYAIESRVSRTARSLARWALGGILSGNLSETFQAIIQRAFITAVGNQQPATPQMMQANKGWIFAANRQIAGRAARVKEILELVQRMPGLAHKISRVHDHAILQLLEEPNPDEPGTIFRWRQVLQLNTTGRNYVLVQPEVWDLSPVLGKPFTVSRIKHMRLLEPDRVQVAATTDRYGAAFYYSSPLGLGMVPYPPAPVTRAEREAWKANPYAFVYRATLPAADSYDGGSPVIAADNSISILQQLGGLWRNQLANGIHAGLIFYLLENTDDPVRFERTIQMLKAGIGKAGEPMALPDKKFKVQESPVKMEHLGYKEMAELARQEALAVSGGSDGIVGLVKDVNRANSEGLERILSIGTIDPLLSVLASAFNMYVVPLFAGQSDSARYRLRYEAAAWMDDVTQVDRLEKLVKAGIYTANEAREDMGKPRHKDGDELILASKSVTVDGTEIPLTETGTPLGKGKGAAAASGAAGTQAAKDGADAADAGAETAKDGAKKKRAARQARAVLLAEHPLGAPEARTEKLRALDEARRTREATLRRTLAPLFKAWGRETCELVREHGVDAFRAIPRDGTAGAQILDRGKRESLADVGTRWQDALAAALEPWIEETALAAAERAAGDYDAEYEFALDADDVGGVMERFAEGRATDAAALIAATQLTRVEDVLSAAGAEGWTVDDTVIALEGIFPASANASELRTIASTEAGIASGNGVNTAARKLEATSATPIGMMWLSRRDNKVREDHAAADGQVVARGEMFTVGGASLRFPGDEACADLAQLANCRCDAVIVPLEKAAEGAVALGESLVGATAEE